MIRRFAVRLQNHGTLKNVSVENNCPDENLRMRGMNLNLWILQMFENTFSFDVPHRDVSVYQEFL